MIYRFVKAAGAIAALSAGFALAPMPASAGGCCETVVAPPPVVYYQPSCGGCGGSYYYSYAPANTYPYAYYGDYGAYAGYGYGYDGYGYAGYRASIAPYGYVNRFYAPRVYVGPGRWVR